MVSSFIGKPKPLVTALRHTLMLSTGMCMALSAVSHAGPVQDGTVQDSTAQDSTVQKAPVQKAPAPESTVKESILQADEALNGARKGADKGTSKDTAILLETRIPLAKNFDWVAMEKLTPNQISTLRPHCCGTYVEPQRLYPEAQLSPADAPLRVSADETEVQGSIATLMGDVQVAQGFRQVRSNQAVVNRAKRSVALTGDIVYREPGLLLTSDAAQVDMDSGNLSANNVVFVLHQTGIRGEAEKLSRPEETRIHIDNALYTSCEPTNTAWQLHASSVDLDTGKEVVTARHVRLKIRDIPVMYLPWIQYPMSDSRASGLLFPSLLTGNDNGLDYAQPIYFNLAPHYDATFTPRLLQERGAMAELEFRHLSESTQTVLSGGYLWDDKGGGSKDPVYQGQDRWSIGVKHRGGASKGWNTFIDYTDVSDVDYFSDIDSATLNISSASHLNQQFKAGYSSEHWDLRAQIQEFETLIVNSLEQYQQLPRIDAKGHYQLGNSDWMVGLNQSFVVFDHSEDDTIGSGSPLTTDALNTTITGSRFRADYSVTWDKKWLWGFFKPELIAKYISYNLDDPLLNHTETNPNVFVPVAAIDTGLFFERQSPWFKEHIQTIEPRLYYLNSSFEDQSAIPNFDTSELTFGYHQLFRNDRFSGGDRIGDTEQVTLGITSRFINQNTGEETLRFSLGQVYYFDNRKVALSAEQNQELVRNNSDIAIELSGQFAKYFRIQSDLLTTDDASTINKGNFTLSYNNQNNSVFNLGYRYTRREDVLVGNEFIRADIDQAFISFAAPVSDNWTLLGRYNQDLRTNQELEVFAGVEYASCCWRASIVARRWVDRDDNFVINTDSLDHNNGLFFQIQFHGLAGIGKRVGNLLRDGIYGYQPLDD